MKPMYFKLIRLVLPLAALVLSPPIMAQDDSEYPMDDAARSAPSPESAMSAGATDSDLAAPAVAAGAVSGPLAFGVVYSDGSKKSGTPNWTSNYNATYKRYEISILGERYYYLDYATNVTPAGDIRFCRSSSVSSMLLVYCYDKQGDPATSRFGFATFKHP